MSRKQINMTIQDILTASNGDDVWFAATNPLEGAMAEAYTSTERAILDKSLRDAESEWNAARLKSIALERAVTPESYPPRELPTPIRIATFALLGAICLSPLAWTIIYYASLEW